MASPAATLGERFELLKVFRRNLDTIISQECKEWAAVIDQARQELEQSLHRGLAKQPVSTLRSPEFT